MPRLTDDNMEKAPNLGTSQYGYSGTKIDSLGASEYTVVCVTADVSYSTGGFQTPMEAALGSVVEALRQSPRADNLLMRLTTFSTKVEEFHGYRPLPDLNPGDYQGALAPKGSTALYDAAFNAVESVSDYGGQLYDADMEVNGIVFVLTDGDDNVSTMTPTAVRKAVEGIKLKEKLESVLVILIGVNVNEPHFSARLQTFQQEAGITKYIELADASPSTLAKLADFVSRSVSAQSQSLGTGGPSQVLTI